MNQTLLSLKKSTLCFVFVFLGMATLTAFALDLEKLSEEDAEFVDSILEKTVPLIQEKEAKGSAVLISFKDLERNLSRKEKKFLKEVLALTPQDLGVKTPRQIEETHPLPMQTIWDQTITKDGKPFVIPPQAISPAAFAAYEKMMSAMKKDLGKKLFIESAHRGKPYHLYNFLKYLAEHHYSLLETAKLNALPGYSEHNLKIGHAIDFINAEGINGEPHVEDYEALPEHLWMLQRAGHYGFTLSYPRNNPWGIAFEPWHWKFTPPVPQHSVSQEAPRPRKKFLIF